MPIDLSLFHHSLVTRVYVDELEMMQLIEENGLVLTQIESNNIAIIS